MNSNSKTVSVVIPFYNNIEWLKEAVNSVLQQSFENYEIIVVNDGSREDDEGFISEFGKSIKYFKIENKGPGAARNIGIEMSKGDYIAFLDSDDLWLPKKLENQIEFMESNKYMWSHTSYSLFNDKTLKIIKDVRVGGFEGDIFLKRHISSPIGTPCVMVNREVFSGNDIRFGEHLRYGQDSYLWGLISDIYPLGALDEVLVKVRIRGANAGRRARVQLQSRANTYQTIKEKRNGKDARYREFPIFPFTLFYLAFELNKIVNFAERKIKINAKIAENISKLLYAPIYLGFKTYNIYLK